MTITRHPWTSRPVAIYWVVTAVAFVLRLWHIVVISDPAVNPSFFEPVTDAGVHHRWAQGLLTGTWPGAEPFFRAPLYPYFLARVYAVFGLDSPLAVQVVHGLVSAFGAGWAALCALRLWSARAAWGAGLLFSLLWSSIYFSGELLATTLCVTLNLLLLWLVLGPVSARQIFLCGAVLGLSAIARPTVLVVTPVLVWYLWQRGGLNRLARGPGWAWLALGLLATIGPVTARNLVRGGEPVLIAASGGVNFYIGNNEHADGRVAFLPGAPHSWQGQMSDAMDLAAAESGQPMGALASDRYFWRQGLRFWQDSPGAAMKLTARKAWLLLASGERSNNKNLAFWRERSSMLRWPFWPGWALVLGLAMLGFARADLPSPEKRLLLGFTVFYALALLLFFINARFRLPLMAWLVVPAGGGLASLLTALQTRSWATMPRAACLAALLLVLVSTVPDALTYHQKPATDFESWRALGNSYLSAGDQARAIATWEKALAIDHDDPQMAHRWTLPQIYQPLGQLHRQRRRPDLALMVQRQWVTRLPDSEAARMGLADLLLQQGQPETAIAQLDTVLQWRPENHEARLGYAWGLHQDGQYSAALVQFELVAQRMDSPSANFGVGISLMKLGQWNQAEAQLKALVGRHPDFWQAYENLAKLYAQSGQPDKERHSLRKLLEHQPGHKKAQARLAQLG